MVKIYRKPNCAKKHRSYMALAKCVWPRAAWIAGEEGPYATVSRCPSGGYSMALTVELHTSVEAAKAALRLINEMACGGICRELHELIELRNRSAEGFREQRF